MSRVFGTVFLDETEKISISMDNPSERQERPSRWPIHLNFGSVSVALTDPQFGELVRVIGRAMVEGPDDATLYALDPDKVEGERYRCEVKALTDGLPRRCTLFAGHDADHDFSEPA
jgi:hypothetical protein